MQYEVPGVTLFVQDKGNACWFASAMMLVNWAERYRPSNPLLGLNKCSAIDKDTLALYQADNGIKNPQIIPLAKRLGLQSVPPMSPSIRGLQGWLMNWGPLWTNGKRHIVVIAGLRGDETVGYEVKVYDPWPGNGVTWRSLDGWYTGFNPGPNGASSRDTGDNVEAVFLHV